MNGNHVSVDIVICFAWIVSNRMKILRAYYSVPPVNGGMRNIFFGRMQVEQGPSADITGSVKKTGLRGISLLDRLGAPKRIRQQVLLSKS